MQTGFIGLGAMGRGMAKNLHAAGFLKTIYNRSSEQAEKLAHQLKIPYCQSPEQLAKQVELIFICVSADADMLEVISKIAVSANPGSIVVDMSTVSSDTAITAAEILASNRVAFLDAPVSGGVEGAKNGSLSMMLGGDQKTFATVRPVLECMATRIVHMGVTGSGQATKAVNQMMAAGINQAVTEAMVFAQAQHLPMQKVIDVISAGAAGNWFLEHRGVSMINGNFAPGFKLALHLKDLKICQHMARKTSAACPIVDKTVDEYQKLIKSGYGDDDISALYRLKIAAPLPETE